MKLKKNELRNFRREVKTLFRRGILCYNINVRLIGDIELIIAKVKMRVDGESRLDEGRSNFETSAPSEAGIDREEPVLPGTLDRSDVDALRGFSWAPFPKIPNVKSFKINTNGYDELLRMFSLDKRLPPSIAAEPYNNGPALKYASDMIKNLRKYAAGGRYGVFWGLAFYIMENSKIFQLMAIYKCFPRFHRDMSLASVYAMLDEMTRVIRNGVWNLEYRRVYIPKTGDKWRPLGVPSPVWRALLSMLNFFLVTAYDGLIPGWQHAYRPGRGVLSAWTEVLSKTRNHAYIWEFDLRSFFDTVNVKRAVEVLGDKMPPKLGDILVNMASIAPKLPAETKLDESQAILKRRFSDDPKHMTWYKEESKVTSSIDWEDDEFMDDVDRREAEFFKSIGREPPVCDGPVEAFLPSDSSPYEFPTHAEGAAAEERRYRGFPQGGSISAFMSVLYLSGVKLPAGQELLMYADDGLISSDEPFDPSDFKDSLKALGLEVSEAKCRWVKRDGEWLAPLKFLGLVLTDGEHLKSQTRRGVEHRFDQHGLVRAVTLSRLGFTVREAYFAATSGLRTFAGKLSASVAYEVQHAVKSVKVGGERVQRLLVTAIPSFSVKNGRFVLHPWGDYKRVTFIGTLSEVYEYYKKVLLGRLTVELEGDLCESVIVESSMLSASKDAGSDPKARDLALSGRLKYLVRTKPLPMMLRAEEVITNGVTWEETLDSRLMGWFQSKMYWEGFTNTRVYQDFELTWKASTSWMAHRTTGKFKYERMHRGIKLDFANSTSVAFCDIICMYRVRQKCERAMHLYKKYLITLDELNAIRRSVGRPPIRGYYVKSLCVDREEFYSGRRTEVDAVAVSAGPPKITYEKAMAMMEVDLAALPAAVQVKIKSDPLRLESFKKNYEFLVGGQLFAGDGSELPDVLLESQNYRPGFVARPVAGRPVGTVNASGHKAGRPRGSSKPSGV